MRHLTATAGAALALLASLSTPVAAQQVTLYGRVDLSIAQRANATDNTELRNGSGSRFGVRGSEDLGDGLRQTVEQSEAVEVVPPVSGRAADFNGDGVVSGADFAIFVRAFNTSCE